MERAPAQGGPPGVEIRETDDGVVIAVRVVPRASRDAIAGARAGALLVRLTAPPVDGAANAALLRVIGGVLGVPPSALRIASGAASRAKRVEVRGLDAADARSRLDAAVSGRERPREAGR